MREIKFRGKTPGENGVWKYGYLLNAKIIGEVYPCMVHVKSNVIIQNTIGQYTGFKDGSGNEIYEGDIIRLDYEDDNGEKAYSNMQIYWNELKASFCVDDSYRSDKTSCQELTQSDCHEVQVVGRFRATSRQLCAVWE